MKKQNAFSGILLAMTLLAGGLIAACGDDDGGTQNNNQNQVNNNNSGSNNNNNDNTNNNNNTQGCPEGTTEIMEDVCQLQGEYTADLTLTANKRWVLSGGVFIGNDVATTVLTIEAGTEIFGETADISMLVVRRHSRIEANGTAQAPIVFTSAKEPGTRARGDWGGLILNGLATTNACYGQPAGCAPEGEGGTGQYGGTDDTSSCGTLR
jgi:hypothetical protein